jgi:prepilin-type N-terminal cleavage/methylation domain-containing protein
MRRAAPAREGSVRRAGRRGFTLLEMMAVVLLTGIVLSAAVRFYIQLSIANRAALERVRGERRTVAIIDRIARDLEAAMLMKRPESVEDPLSFPWLFLADEEGTFGATRLKFATRGRVPHGDLPESDFEVVAYWLAEGADGSLDLLRWSHPHLPERLDRAFPRNDDPEVAVLAHGVAEFGVRLQSDTGELTAAWDSSQLVQSNKLPMAAQITLVLYPENDDGSLKEADPDAEADLEPELPASRWAFLQMKPIDLEAQRDPEGADDAGEEVDPNGDDDGDGIPNSEDDDDDGGGDEDDPEACMTVGQCVSLNQAAFNGLPPETQATIQSMSGMCFRDVAGSLPVAVQGCE